MSEKTLDFIQIYYKEEQIGRLYDFAIPYFNESVTPYFENSVIADLVPESKADLISVASWKLKQKRGAISSYATLKAAGGKELTSERILKTAFDVAILTPRPAEHKMLFMARQWHGQVWDDAFSILASFLRHKLQIKVSQEITLPIYGNHFIARNLIYHEYVKSCLIPTMDFIEKTADVFTQGAGYRIVKERLGEFDTLEDYEKVTGRKDWMIGVFLLERLFSIWINDKKMNVINL
ncbi:MAG TPA: hypothetical protein VIM65_07490 [Cyclobacteriaceae bacterium]